jgi:hypothetical protein
MRQRVRLIGKAAPAAGAAHQPSVDARRYPTPRSGRSRKLSPTSPRATPPATASAQARELLIEARGLSRQGLGEVLDAGFTAERLHSWKDLYNRLGVALDAARDAERLVDAIELRRL